MTSGRDNTQPSDWDRVFEILCRRSDLTYDDRVALQGMIDRADAPDAGLDRRLLRGRVLRHFAAELGVADTCEADFLAVLREDPTNKTAIGLLGPYYFHCGRWEAARHFLARTLLYCYRNRGRGGRQLEFNIREFLVCCDIRTGKVRRAVAAIPKLLDEMSRAAEFGEGVVPEELIRTLETQAIRVRELAEPGEWASWIQQLRALAGDSDSLRDVLEKFERPK
jgi:hypothetical protein